MDKKQKSNTPLSSSELRSLAEERLEEKQLSAMSSPLEMLKLVHELQIHQVELELQQEELVRTRLELEKSLAMYTEFYDFAPAGYLTLSQDSKIEQANLTATRLLGVDRSRLLGMHLKQFVVPEDYRVIDALLETVFSKRAPANCEVKLLASLFKPSTAHSVRTFRIEAAVSDATQACRIILSDITAQKVSEESLRKSERNFRSITEQMADEVVVIDSTGTLTYVSPVVEKLFGYLPHEVISHPFTDYMLKQDIPEALQVFKNALHNNTTNHIFEVKLKRKDSSLFDGEIHLQYYQDQDQDISGMIGLIRDISERRHAEQALRDSERMFRSITEQISEVVFVNNSIGEITYVSPIVEKITGYKPDELLGHAFFEYMSEEDIPRAIAIYTDAMKHQLTNQVLEFMYRKKDGSLFHAEIHSQYFNDNGSSGVIGLLRDISERKLFENQLVKLSTAVEQSPAVVVITDPLGNIEYVNPAFTELTGYSIEETKGQNPRILQSGLTPESVFKDLWETILSGGIWRGEFQNKKKNGELFWETAVISAIIDKNGVITNFIAVKEDITEQKTYLAELIAAKEKAEESDHLKSAFLANISHEIRTPMNGILGFSELLKEPHLSGEEMTEYIDLIQQSGHRMLHLINDLIDISRIDAEETNVEISETPLNKLLQDIHSFFKPNALSKGLRLTYTTGLSDSESLIKTDSGKLNQILINLVNNALKFTSKGGIDFGYTKKDGNLEFYVVDTGIGIPVDMKNKVFDRFRQVDNTLTRGYEGAGLGLSITKAFVTMLGGTIRVESIDGAGTTFSFTLPYNPVNAPNSSSPDLQDTKAPEILPHFCILIAEDDEVSTVLLKHNLKGENVTILCAVNGWEAVELVQHHPEINLVLMDIKMPVMNGFEATRLIKQQRPDLPVIAQSAFTSIGDKEKAKEAGCDSFITKPIRKSELLELIQDIIHR